MMDWIVRIGGWLVGATMALLVVMPWMLEQIHRALPVYKVDPVSATVTCTPAMIIFSARAKKIEDFEVIRDDELDRLRIDWMLEGIEQRNSVPLISPDGSFVPTWPTFVAGDEFVVGPFVVPRRESGTLFSVTVVLPGYRWGLYRTTADIGPIYLPPCPAGLMRRGELRNFIAPLIPPRVRFAGKKLDDPDLWPDVLVDALPEFRRLP